MAEYPTHLVRTRTLADGRKVTIRPIRADDEPAEQAFLDHLSGETKRLRFLKFVDCVNEKLVHFFTHIDYDRHMAFVCEAPLGDRARLVGEARYVGNPDGRSCELGVVIADDWHRTGIAGLLMEALIRFAQSRAFETMEGLVLADNHDMLRFVKALGFEVHRAAEDPTTVRIVRKL